jgi:hypothetical protein
VKYNFYEKTHQKAVFSPFYPLIAVQVVNEGTPPAFRRNIVHDYNLIPMKSKPNPEFDEFTKIIDRALSVPHSEILRREKEYQERAEQNPK